MFRKPRNDARLAEQLGRPPSPTDGHRPPAAVADLPPSESIRFSTSTNEKITVKSEFKPAGRGPAIATLTDAMATTKTASGLAGGSTPRKSQVTNTTTPSKGSKTKSSSNSGGPDKSNQSILRFFKKADPPSVETAAGSIGDDDDNDLFVKDLAFTLAGHDCDDATPIPAQVPTPPQDEEPRFTSLDASRFNEDACASKRRKTHGQLLGRSLSPRKDLREASPQHSSMEQSPIKEEEQAQDGELSPKIDRETLSPQRNTAHEVYVTPMKREDSNNVQHHVAASYTPPSLTRESTSILDEAFNDDDFIDDETLAEFGEEFLERRYAEEQRRLELEAMDSGDTNGDGNTNSPSLERQDIEEIRESIALDESAPPCPICNIALAGITAEQASSHVNNCLDGRPTPLPKPVLQPPGVKPEPVMPAKRFMKASIARPGQQNPFDLNRDAAAGSSGSAFSKLMSGHAEDTAWATAAANEVASRGKPAFKRTCPFYKILPGFNICVDAFRYGAVQGCNAYFLSHFHSDHYIGLTSSWCHGPIYCSRVTANLVRQQLRVDARYVVPLEFEEKFEVPATNGVSLTMISANHCPGSSLFLFEKAVYRDSKQKKQRVLHCGDFRACPAHVQHPLLMPNIVDAVTGKSREQKIDVCYLDTTYLTPRYAFPLQTEVVQACSEMCVSLSKERIDENDGWERVKRERAGAGMVKFVRSDSQAEYNGTGKEVDEDGGVYATRATDNGTAARGRLLVVVGTYSIGKERICMGIAKALNSKIYATSGKQRICAALEDAELTSRLTSNPLEAQVHMQMLGEIRPETLAEYLASYRPHFSRIVGFRPSGWNYRPPNSRFTDNPLVQTVLHSDNWKSRYSMAELMPQRGSTREAACFGVPYSEHSSFRELTMFCCALRIDKIIPTVNIGSAKSRERMKGWFEKWEQEKKKNGLYEVAAGTVNW